MSRAVVDLVLALGAGVLLGFASLVRLRCRQDDRTNDRLWQDLAAEASKATSGRWP